MSVSTAVLLLFSALAAQTPLPPPPAPRPTAQPAQPPMPPRDVVRRPEPTGTGVIRGRVVAGDTGSPIRRANVNLSPIAPPMPPPGSLPATAAGTSAPPTVTMTGRGMLSGSGEVQFVGPSGMAMARPRSVTTDAQGNFEFSGLPAGSYRVMANAGQYSAGYLGIAFGAKRAMGPVNQDPGTPIVLADGQRFDKATIALPRGAVITGRVTDENGDPLARVQVYTLMFTPSNPRGMRAGSSAQTDDLGHFRLYGLNVGDYSVVAEAREPTFVQPNAPPETDEDKIGFMTTYYPGTPDEAAAQRVRTRLGAETPGIEIRMATGRLFRISGMVTDSQGRPAARTNGQLFKRTANMGGSSYGFNTDEQGRFQMKNIPPGAYRLIARGRQEPGMEGRPGEPGEMAAMPLTINSDLEGVILVTSPGATITGQVVFEQGPPQLPPAQQSFQMRISANIGDPQANIGMNSPQPGLVTPDLTFTMRGLHGELLLRTSGPGMFLKAVTVTGRDITDTPYEFKNGDKVTMVMSTRASTLEGAVTDAAGKPVIDAAILVFSEDKASWRANSTRTRRGITDNTGKYRVMGLMAGRYYAIALPRNGLVLPTADAEVFEQLTKEATAFVVGDDEQRQVDLKLSTGSGG